LFGDGIVVARVAVSGTVTITFQVTVDANAVPADKCGENKKNFTNRSSSTTREKTDEPNKTNNNATTTVIVDKDCNSNYDVIKTVNKATAKPGETLIYTIVVKNTGETDLTNIVIKDILPGHIASAKATTTAPSEVSGDLFKEGVTIAKLQPGQIATIEVEAIIKDAKGLPCGETILINRVNSSTDQTNREDNLNNNTAKTTVNKDCPEPKKPCRYNPKLDYDDPDCIPPVTPPVIPPTGPVEAAAAIVGVGALTFGATAYARSRKDLVSKLLKK
jgi:uncharacterized repeat protein (TIGR01451 family)